MQKEDSKANQATACLLLDDGTLLTGQGFGAEGCAVGELCFNTAMTGYQEILTDPSYCGQIITFTFPHIGNVGVNLEDMERESPAAAGMITRLLPTRRSNWRARSDLSNWMSSKGLIGCAGMDTRMLTRKIREMGAPLAAVEHSRGGNFDLSLLKSHLDRFPGLFGLDLAMQVTSRQAFEWNQSIWKWPSGYRSEPERDFLVVAVDYGAKHNILRCLSSVGCETKVVTADSSADDILRLEPDGLFLSNGPGDPAATGAYAVPMIREVIDRSDIPVFGICLGHQMLALALGGNTVKMNHGHHGANHPVKDIRTGKVEITSMNHGFAVDRDTLPSNVLETHVSLFDGTNCGLCVRDKPVFSVQFHPEASPGPQDCHYLFRDFSRLMRDRKKDAR
ncbi:MAG: glutamine-hydrolyzing carbamoyl-phosphate synthase small subunit [Rhodobacteraceae bacterium]|nr:glutamine-hydrolyzing carbamoyl-phosphate synthase small subunit [Paracoccaceae bacterium]